MEEMTVVIKKWVTKQPMTSGQVDRDNQKKNQNRQVLLTRDLLLFGHWQILLICPPLSPWNYTQPTQTNCYKTTINGREKPCRNSKKKYAHRKSLAPPKKCSEAENRGQIVRRRYTPYAKGTQLKPNE